MASKPLSRPRPDGPASATAEVVFFAGTRTCVTLHTMTDVLQTVLGHRWGPWILAGIAVCLGVAAIAADRTLRRWWRRAVFWRRRRRAARGERDAEQLVRRWGYRVESTQPELDWSIAVDGEPHDVCLRADLLVRRGRRRYVADVKTGRVAPRPTHSSTRRQLLEYRVAYPGVDGVLLVDMEEGDVREVAFPGIDYVASSGRSATFTLAFVLGLAAGASATVWLLSL